MKSLWRRTLCSVSIILSVNDAYIVYSQSLPPGATLPPPFLTECGVSGPVPPQLMNSLPPFVQPNGVFPDVLPGGRPFPDAIQSPGPANVPPPRASLPHISQILYNLPSPSITGPLHIYPLLPPPPITLGPPHYTSNAPGHGQPSILPPIPPFLPNFNVLAGPYLDADPYFIPGPLNLPPQNPGIPPAAPFLPDSVPGIFRQGSLPAQFNPNIGPVGPHEPPPQLQYIPGLSNPNFVAFNPQQQLICPTPPPTVPQASQFFPGLPNPDIIAFNPQIQISPPINQHMPNANPIVPYPQCPPIVPPFSQFIPGFCNPPISQLQALPPPPQFIPNLNSIGPYGPPPFSQFVPNENIEIPNPPISQGPVFQFVPNSEFRGPFPHIQSLPPAVPPFFDPNFGSLNSQQFYPEPNIIFPYLPPPVCPFSPQFASEISNSGPILPEQTINVPEIFLQRITPPPFNALPPPFIQPPLPAQNYPTIPQRCANPTVFTNQPQVFFPTNYYGPSLLDSGMPPNFQINSLPMVIQAEPVQTPSGDNPLPINLQINLPATNIPPPYITIISTAPPTPPIPEVVETFDADSPSFSMGSFAPFPMYTPPPVIVKGSKSRRKKWIPMLLALFANRGCCGGCGGGCSCPCGSDIPIPYPIPIPTNNPIVVSSKATCPKCSLCDSNDLDYRDQSDLSVN